MLRKLEATNVKALTNAPRFSSAAEAFTRSPARVAGVGARDVVSKVFTRYSARPKAMPSLESWDSGLFTGSALINSRDSSLPAALDQIKFQKMVLHIYQGRAAEDSHAHSPPSGWQLHSRVIGINSGGALEQRSQTLCYR